MKILNALIAAWLLISVPCNGTWAQTSITTNENSFLHTVEKGQSLYSIASMYHVSQSDIVSLNPGCDEKIYAGQTLRIPQSSNQQSNRFHTIQPNETLYRLTVTYGISAKKICDANPGLSAENFRIGQVIVIPAEEEESPATLQGKEPTQLQTPDDRRDGSSHCREIHKVKRKETIYSVCREYGISKQELLAANPELKDGMKKGMYLCIPYTKDEKSATAANQTSASSQPQSNSELFAQNREEGKNLRTMKAALILPFKQQNSSSAESLRMIEYYEGFLMAADSLKRKGVSIDLFVYDSGNTKVSLNAILDKEEMKQMNIIFGPLHTGQIKPLANFAKKHKIHLVIPFTSKDNEVFSNPRIYQINTPQSYLYSEVYEHFTRKFTNANVIFLQTAKEDKEKAEFVKGLQQELKAQGITYKTLPESAPATTLKEHLAKGKDNIFIPTSGTNTTLIRTLPQLIVLTRENPEEHITLFGYPEWQTYTKDHLDSFYELDTYFYSSFYTNNLFPSAVNFTNSYRRWYGKDMVNSYPKFGMLGFDTAFFFLKALSTYGNDFEQNIRDVQVTPIQTGFKFERVNNWGGFINRKVFFVHFTKNFELIKLDFE